MDQKLICYEEPKLLPFDGRARLMRFCVEGQRVYDDEVMLFSAENKLMNIFESPQHAKLWCTANGVEMSDKIGTIDLAETYREMRYFMI